MTLSGQAAGGALRLSSAALGAAAASGELARQATGGDLDAFEQLVRRFQKRVYGFAYQHLADADEAQDLAQEVFVRLYRNLSRFDASRPFEPWFWKLAGNVALNYRRRRVPVPEEALDLAAAPAAEPDRALRAALAALDPGYRLPLLLHYYADLPLQEVAAELGLSLPALKSRMHRTRALLRRALEAEP